MTSDCERCHQPHSLELPAVMCDPSLLPPGERWARYCPDDCGLLVQGGRAGMMAHRLVVHQIEVVRI